MKDLQTYAEELGMKIDLQHPEAIAHTKEDKVVGKQKIGEWAKKAMQNRQHGEMEEERWQPKLMANR